MNQRANNRVIHDYQMNQNDDDEDVIIVGENIRNRPR